jgi:hypothetical protein
VQNSLSVSALQAMAMRTSFLLPSDGLSSLLLHVKTQAPQIRMTANAQMKIFFNVLKK